MRFSALLRASAALVPAIVLGCGGDDTTPGTGGSGGGGGDTTTAGGSGGGGGATGSTTAGGSGGGAMVCSPGATQPCYTGPEGTLDVGLCKAGTQTCKANGEGFGDCTGDVTPAPETCLTIGDDDCDGKVNEDGEACACTPGEMKDCYSGPMETLGVGACQGGVQVCKLDGSGYEECAGEIVPQAETCLTPQDDDCDGLINEEGEGCVCVPGAMIACYTGPAGTEGVGICAGGVSFCDAAGTGYGPCTGQITPQAETCFTAEDDDCDGAVNEDGAGCVCVPGSLVPCYTGPAGTSGVGDCHAGAALCNALGTAFGGCEGQVVPQAETCELPGDEDCDGLVNEEGPGCSCAPGATQPCYSGPDGTEDVGACKGGVQTCAPDGSGFGACVGEVVPSVEDCATPENEDCQSAPDCGGHLWSKRIGSAGDQQANAIARDGQNNSFITGRFAGSFTTGGNTITSAGGYDVFVVKLDPAGNTLWSKRFGDAAIYQEGLDVAADALGNVFVTGYFEGTMTFGATVLTSAGGTDIFLAKLDPSGNPVWAKRFGGAAAQYGQSLAVDPQGNVTLLADGFGTVDFGAGGLTSAGDYDMFVARFDPGGNLFWAKRFGGAGGDVGQGVAADAAGNIVLIGKSDGAIDFGGGALAGAGALDAVIAKLDPLGSLLWAKRWGDGANQFGADVAVNAQNEVLVTGGFEGSIDLGGGALAAVGSVDMYTGKLTAGGAHLWSERFGAVGASPSALGIAAGTAGDAFVVGQLSGTLDFGGGALTAVGGSDAFVVRLGSNGAHAWSKRFGAGGNQYAAGAAVDGLGQLLVTGYFEQSIDFGGGALTSAGALDMFVARLAP